MIHDLLISLHAACALIAFILGLAVVCRPAEQISPIFRGYLSTLSLMVLFLVMVVLVDWTAIDMVRRVVYSALLVLAAYTGWRGWRSTAS